MSQSRKNSRSASIVPLYAAQPRRTQARRRAGALLMGTTLSAVIGLSYGRGVYAQTVLSGRQTDTQTLNGPDEFVTEDGFSVDTSDSTGDAITITTGGGEKGDTTFTDNYASMINGAGDGISAVHSGTGELRLTTTGDVAGGTRGMLLVNNGSGALTITTSGAVTGETSDGILAKNSQNTTDLTIEVNNVTGGYYGIYADNEGGGALSIMASGAVMGETSDGIQAFNSQNSTGLTIEVDNVTGGSSGIDADNDGSGALSITTTGTVIGTSDVGIYANNSINSTQDLTIAANDDVTGGTNAIAAKNYGTGDLTIEASGSVSTNGADYEAIFAETGVGAGDLSITVGGNVSNTAQDGEIGGGIYAKTVDSDTSITLEPNALVSSSSGFGIIGLSEAGSITITATDSSIEGGIVGVFGAIFNTSYGGPVPGVSDEAINASYDGPAPGEDDDINISVADVTGGLGVYAANFGPGSVNITATGDITGTEYAGIAAISGKDVTITIAESGSVSVSGTDAETGLAIAAFAPNGAVIVNNFGTVTGSVDLTNSNTFTNAGTWKLAGTTSNFNTTGDSLVANEGLIIAASDDEADETPWLNNLDTFRNNAGGTVRLTDGGAGDVFEIGNGGGQASANFVANGGTVELDVVLGGDSSAADRLNISGDVILDGAPTALAINSVGGGTGGETTTGIEVVTVVNGTSDAGAFVLAGPVEVGALSYDLSLGQCDDTANDNWYLCNNGTIGTTGAVFEAMPGVVLNSFARTETLQQRLGARVQGGTGPTLSTQGDADLPVAQSVGPWMRTWGDFADITPDNSSAGTSLEADSWGLEAGIGTILGDHAGGNLVGGVNLRYGATYADLSNPVGTASLNAEGFGMAASLTWFGNDGFYVDGNAAVDFVSIDATSQGGGELLNDHDDVVYSASTEVGKRIELQGGTTLVPQAQLSWGKMRDGSLTDNLGNVVSFADRETLTSRVGLTVEQDVTGSSWGAGKVFGFGKVLHDLEGSRTATVAGTDVTQSGTGDWLELGGGFSLQPTENSNVFGQVSYREAFNGVDGDAIAVSAGWRMQW